MVYERPQSYYDSKDTDPEQVLLHLSMGRRNPQNEYEESLLKQIREIEAKWEM